jgi:hypothetical protein
MVERANTRLQEQEEGGGGRDKFCVEDDEVNVQGNTGNQGSR